MVAAALVRNQCQIVIGAHLAQSKESELNGETWLVDLLGGRIQRFVDVGANRGVWSRHVLAASPHARGLLVEPSTSALAQLKETFSDDDRVEIVEGAAGAQGGSATFYEGPDADMLSSLVVRPDKPDAVSRTVTVHALDDLLPEHEWNGADVVKIDAEGYDCHVVAGASRLLEHQSLALVQFEYNSQWAWAGSTLAHALALLESVGYRVYALRPGSLLPVNYALIGDFFSYANFVAIAPRSMPWLGGHFDASIPWSPAPTGYLTAQS